jgi:hypothetical protein
VEALDALAGRYVGLLSVDNRLTLMLAGEPGVEDLALTLASPFVFTDAEGSKLALDPEQDQSRLGPVFSMFMQTIESVSLGARGALSVVFESGARLDIEPHPQFEAWEVSGRSIGRWICVEGGEIQHVTPRCVVDDLNLDPPTD